MPSVKLVHFLLQLAKSYVYTIEMAIHFLLEAEKSELDLLCKIPHESFQ
jgi:hypothetical protein